MALKINNISKTYSNGVQALKNITLSIPNGMYGLLGPNGAGKSTLMRILATLQEPDEGEILLDGINLLKEQGKLRRVLGYLPQEFGLYPKVKAETLLNHFAILKGVTHKKERKVLVEGLLKRTNLWDVRNQKVGGFSGGMRQRFGIATALLNNPRLLIVDEPTAGLDPTERARFLNVLSELGENSVVILSTHIVEDVSELCTNMAIIKKGQILLEADPLEAIKELDSKVWSRKATKEQVNDIEKKFSIISTKLLSGSTIVRIYSNSAPGDGFEPAKADLKDVYFCNIAGYIRSNTF